MDDKLELRSDIMERLDDMMYAIQQAKEDFSDYDVHTLSETELKAVLAKATEIKDYVRQKSDNMCNVLDADKIKLDTVTLCLQGVRMCLDDCKARLCGCIDILLNKPLKYAVPNLAELDEMSKELRAKVQELYNADLGKLLATVRILP